MAWSAMSFSKKYSLSSCGGSTGLMPSKMAGCPLAGVAADEAVEVLEAKAGRPQVERARLTGVPVGDVVILAVPSGVVAVLLQHLGERAATLRHERVVAGKAGARFHDAAGRVGMVVAPVSRAARVGEQSARGSGTGCNAGRSSPGVQTSASEWGRQTCWMPRNPRRRSG